MNRLAFTLTFALIALIANILSAQTVVNRGPVTTAMRLAWTAPVGITATDHPTFEVRLRDSFTGTAVTAITNAVCSGAPITCTAQLTQVNVDALNMVGVHNITLFYFRQDVGDGSISLPFQLTTPAGAPTNLRVIQ